MPRRCLARPLQLDLPPHVGAIMAQKGRQWPVGATLGVRFLNGSPSLQAKVMARFHAWTEQAGNLAYQETNSRSAELRVVFPNDGASWSYIGTDGLHIPLDQPTINLGWFDDQTPDDELDRIGLHEIGHSRSYLHEHSRPEVLALLNRPAIYADLMGPPNHWTRQDVDEQVFATPDPATVMTTPVDINSIMEYPWSAADTLNHQPIAGGRELTPYDIALDRQLYPWPDQPAPPPPSPPPPTHVDLAAASWTMGPRPGGGAVFLFGRGNFGSQPTLLSREIRPLGRPRILPGPDTSLHRTVRPGVQEWVVGQTQIGGHWFEIVEILDTSGS